ncbi:hypothetical protein [Pedobacter sp. ASV28]|uniref:hypothetical protein n=1 Tax=Pedobacter sp. ASV28 TaxID=2795123 RepID=UPI0018EE3FCA|nr:hypothetical protein [Pedobacter sp. ASV28]
MPFLERLLRKARNDESRKHVIARRNDVAILILVNGFHVMFLYARILFLLPILIQLLVGGLTMAKKVEIPFGWLALANFIFLFFVVFILPQFVKYEVTEVDPKCGMPQIAAIFFGVLSIGFLLFVVTLQLIWMKIMKTKISNLKAGSA